MRDGRGSRQKPLQYKGFRVVRDTGFSLGLRAEKGYFSASGEPSLDTPNSPPRASRMAKTRSERVPGSGAPLSGPEAARPNARQDDRVYE